MDRYWLIARFQLMLSKENLLLTLAHCQKMLGLRIYRIFFIQKYFIIMIVVFESRFYAWSGRTDRVKTEMAKFTIQGLIYFYISHLLSPAVNSIKWDHLSTSLWCNSIQYLSHCRRRRYKMASANSSPRSPSSPQAQ